MARVHQTQRLSDLLRCQRGFVAGLKMPAPQCTDGGIKGASTFLVQATRRAQHLHHFRGHVHGMPAGGRAEPRHVAALPVTAHERLQALHFRECVQHRLLHSAGIAAIANGSRDVHACAHEGTARAHQGLRALHHASQSLARVEVRQRAQQRQRKGEAPPRPPVAYRRHAPI